MNKINRINKFRVLNIAVLIVALFTVIYVIAVGSHYTLHSDLFFDTEQPYEFSVSFSDDNIVRLDNTRVEKGELLLDFSTLDQGKTTVNITCSLPDSADVNTAERVFKVNLFGTLYDYSSTGLCFSGYQVVIVAVIAVMFLIQLVMLWKFFEYQKDGDFSYKMIACGGIGIYALVLFLFLTYKLLNNVILSINTFFSLITESARTLLIALLPLMMALSVLLAVSNIWLIRHEGRRPVNTLGIIFAIVWFIGMLLTVGAHLYMPLEYIVFYYRIRLILEYIIGYFECMFLATVAGSVLASKYKPALDQDYIIILGCAIRSDGSLTPLLKGRVDSAVAFEKEQYEQTGKHAVFVPSGGQGADEVISEGEAMENYLKSIGIPQEQIAREDKSVNTFQNMKLSREVIEKHGGETADRHIAFATTNYHVFRGYILAQKNGFQAKGISAKTKPYFYLNAFLREFIGLLVDRKVTHIAFIVITIAVVLLQYRS